MGPTTEDQTPEAEPDAARATGQTVPGLPEEDADEQVLRDILGADVDHGLLDFAAGAGGNRQLLAELAHGLVEEGLVREHGGRMQLVRRRLPGRVLTLVRHWLSELSANCQQFLKVAAVLGRAFRLEDVSRMLGRSSASLLPPLDDAMASGFVVAAEHQFEFKNDFLLLGVIESIPAPARGALQREAMSHAGSARVYDQQFWPAKGPIWVTEAQPGVSGSGDETTGDVYSKAHGLIMNGEAATGVRVAESVLSNPSSSAAARLDAEVSLVLGYSILGREQAERHSERILQERRSGQVDIATLMALTILSNYHWRIGELAEGLSLGRAAVRNSENIDPVWRLHFQLALAGKLANLCEFDKAEALINEVEAGLQGLPTQVWAAAPAALRSRLFFQAGRFEDARRQAESATAAVAPDAVPVLRPLAYSVLSAVSLHTGDLPAAAEYLKRMQGELAENPAVLFSMQYAWAEVHFAVKSEGPQAAIELLADKYSHLPAQRSLYIEEPSAAAFLVRLALDTGDTDLRHSVLETVDSLMADNPGISVTGLSAMHANALANGDPAALARIIAQSPDPISIALATDDLAGLHSAGAPAAGQRIIPIHADASLAGSEGVDQTQNGVGWAGLSDAERHIAYLVSVGLTNHQIAKRVHLSAHTVNYHLRKVYRKLGVNTRVELARRAAIYSMGDQGEAGHR